MTPNRCVYCGRWYVMATRLLFAKPNDMASTPVAVASSYP